MEEGVTNQLLKSDLGEIFDQRHFVSDVSGAGNNWAQGHF
jgi:tubulin epsilon